MTDTTNDQPTRTPEMQAWLDRALPVQQRYSADHKSGLHRGNPVDGCASCVFSGAFEEPSE
jgi:hypothetical protein